MTYSSEQLEADKKIIASATPGPWINKNHMGTSTKRYIHTENRGGLSLIGETRDLLNNAEIEESNAAFISRARTAWPAAIEEIERLRLFLMQKESTPEAKSLIYDVLKDQINGQRDFIRKCTEENSRLRAALEWFTEDNLMKNSVAYCADFAREALRGEK